jgi:hypothetical protein
MSYPCRAVALLLLLFEGICFAESATVRVATFNVSLYGERSGEVLSRLRSGNDSQARHLAEIIQRVRPDVLLLNEIDYDAQGEVLNAFCEKYLAVPQHVSKSPGGPAQPIEFPHRFSAPVNTGQPSGFDLSRDGRIVDESGSDAYAADCWGYGRYEGQYGMAILSKFPIDEAAIRTFRNFRWKDMPGARLPDDPGTEQSAGWYPADAVREFPLSSKSHWDVPVIANGRRVHLLTSHPTPPVFDGAEDRNGRRNHDEVRFWVDYVNSNYLPAPSPRRDGSGEHGQPEVARAQPDVRSTAGRGDEAGTRLSTPPQTPPHQGEGNGKVPYIYDDAGVKAHLAPNESFIILGDLNGDPHDGEGRDGIRRLLEAPEISDYSPPTSEGAVEQSNLQGGANARHLGPPEHDTCDPADDPGPGNLRIDYVLPSRNLKVAGLGVFWPKSDDPLFPLVGVHPFPSSDHRLVWVDLDISRQPSAFSHQPERGKLTPSDR